MASTPTKYINIKEGRIPLFNGDNYSLWQVELQRILAACGLWLLTLGEDHPENTAAFRVEVKKYSIQALHILAASIPRLYWEKVSEATLAENPQQLILAEFVKQALRYT
jgi:hypothetical protein